MSNFTQRGAVVKAHFRRAGRGQAEVDRPRVGELVERYGLQAYWQGFLRRHPEAET